MKLRDYVLAQIAHQETKPIPYTIKYTDEVALKLDAHYGTPSWRDRIKPYIVKVSIIDYKYKSDIDAMHYYDGFGSLWRCDSGFPHLERPALLQPDFDGYEFPKPEFFIRENLRNPVLTDCERYADSFRIAGFGWGLFEQSWVMRGFENVLTDMVLEPDFYEELLDRIVDMQLAFIKTLSSLAVDGIFFSDDWGEQRGVIMGPALWRKFLKPRLAKLYRAVHDSGKLVLGHCCGNVSDIIGDLIEIGHDVLESVQPEAMDPFELKGKWGENITFWGALGSQSIIPYGTPEQIRQQVKLLADGMGKGGGYILAPSKPLQPETPVENAAAIIEAFEDQA